MNNVLNYLYDQADEVCSCFYNLMEYLKDDASDSEPDVCLHKFSLVNAVWRALCNMMVTFEVLDLKGVDVDESKCE